MLKLKKKIYIFYAPQFYSYVCIYVHMCTKRHALKRNWKEAPDGILEVGNILFFDLGSAYMIFFFLAYESIVRICILLFNSMIVQQQQQSVFKNKHLGQFDLGGKSFYLK